MKLLFTDLVPVNLRSIRKKRFSVLPQDATVSVRVVMIQTKLIVTISRKIKILISILKKTPEFHLIFW